MRFAQFQQKQHSQCEFHTPKICTAKWKKIWHKRLQQLHLFQLHLSGAKIKSILVPLKRETIMIRFILLWDQKWEANSIVSVYMYDEASKLIFNRDWDWEYHRLWSSQKQAQCWKEDSITQPLESKRSFAEKIQNRKIIQLAQVQVLQF